MDQFYTTEKVAKKCMRILNVYVDLDDYDIHLEPNAGTCSFFDLMDEEKRVGIDLDPKHDDVYQMDFFDFDPEDDSKYIVIGNPPFGKISSLAVKFFNKSAEFADCIVFIVPRTFKRVSIQNQLNLSFHLIHSVDLPLKPCCFVPKMSAKCCFQIWKRMVEPRELVVYDKTHDDFEFLKLGPLDSNNQPTPPRHADFVIKAYGSNCGEIKTTGLMNLRPKSWHWIKSNIDVDELISRFNQLDYSISKDTVRQDSIGQQEVIHLYKQFFDK